jgi:DNA-binding winged helix-turn-helix (wHTH) protein/tetratricopeptide (TPR) repeat protein
MGEEQSKLVYEFGPFTLDASERLLLRNGKAVALNLKACEILLILVENGGHVIEKSVFLEKVWPNTYVDESNLTQNIFRLRKVLGRNQAGSLYIETVPKRGYRFVADLRVVDNGAESRINVSRRTSRAERQRISTSSNLFINSLVVMPLENLDATTHAEHFSDGIMERILNSLSQLPQLRVIAWSTVVHYKRTSADVFKVGRELGVQYGLTGNFLVTGSRLVVRLELVDIENGWQVWGEEYRRDFPDILVAQEDISWEVSERLRLKFTGEEKQRITRRHTKNSKAFQLYLRGRFFWNKGTAESLKKAISYIQSAIGIDPHFALAYAGLADCYSQLGHCNLLAPRSAFSRAKAAAMRALELDETLSEAKASLALVSMSYDWDWSSAERGFKQAIAQDPHYAPARQWYARYLSQMGRFAEALAEIERARQLDPLSLACQVTMGQILYLAREYDQAIEQCQETIEMNPDFGQPYKVMSMAYAQKGMYDEAIDSSQKVSNLTGKDPEAAAYLGCFYAAIGDREKALEKLHELDQLAKHKYVSSGCMSLVFLGLGEKDQAIAYLEKGHQERSELLTYLKVLPIFDSIRSDERFVNLLQRMSLYKSNDSWM